MSLGRLIPKESASRDLAIFTRLVIAPLSLYGFKELAAWQHGGNARNLIFGLTMLAQVGNHVVCLALLRRGHFDAALRMTCWGILGLFSFGCIHAQGDPVTVVIPLMGVALALPHFNDREFKIYSISAWLLLLANLLALRYFPMARLESRLESAIADLLSCASGVAVTLLLFWQVKDKLSRGESALSLAQSEASLEERRYRLIVEQAGEGIAVFSLEGGVLAQNQIMREIMENSDPEIRKMLFRRCADDESVSHEFQLGRLDASGAPMRWVLLNAMPLRGPNGAVNGVLAMASEISALKRLRAELEQTLGVEAEGRLAGGIAHDMNNVLAVINGACDLLGRQLGEADNAAKAALEGVSRPAKEAAAVIKQLLAYRKAPEPVTGADAKGGRERILLVDDEPELRSITARMLRMNGYQVMEAGSAGEAMAIHGLSGADLLLSDILMPGTPGTVLAIQLRARQAGLAVLLSSGYAGDELPAEGEALPHSAFIAKPYSSAELNQKVREALLLVRLGNTP